MSKTKFGEGLIEGLQEALAWKRGEIALETVNITPMPAARVKEIRKQVASSTKAFEARFGIPASTVNNWEQGRREPDPAARLLLLMIAKNPDLVEATAREASSD